MKLRVSVILPQGGMHDITLSCDVTTTVADVSRALIRAGLTGSRELEKISHRRLAPVTLRAQPQTGETLLLDPMSALGSSGLQSGWIIQPVLELGGTGEERRLIEVAGYVEVLTGDQGGWQFSLIAGSNIIGREASSRVHLLDPSVSRRHAVIEADGDPGLLLKDLGSANGLIVDSKKVSELRITAPTTVHLGETELRILPGPPVAPPTHYDYRVMHIRAPRVAGRFPNSERELPAPPPIPQTSRMPTVAMLAPMLLGGAMYAITKSPMSLMMIAFSPMMMIGSWIDSRWGGRRKHKEEVARFREELEVERTELTELHLREIEVRSAETPTIDEVITAITDRDELLWTRRPEHRSFLEVRFGEGTLPSRTDLALPQRGNAPRDQWNALQCLSDDFEHVAPVPVIERFERCGSIGIAGERIWAEGMASALVLQLVGLHSPYEIALACFAGPQHSDTWNWLKWLPHVDPVASPVSSWQLADSERSATRLLASLEALLETRRASGNGGAAHIRSHLATDTRNDADQGDAVSSLPSTPSVIVLILEQQIVDTARLIEIGETGPDYGIHLIWVTEHRADIPAACRTFVDIDQATGRVHFVRTGTVVPLSKIEFLDPSAAFGLARRLSPVEDAAARVLDESDLPKAVHLRELHQTDLLGGGAPILRTWTNTGSLVSTWQHGQERPATPLDAVVGHSPDGPAVIDLRMHGPHALVGGTTGAGKSEFLQTWIMSMAANVSPDRLTFLLVDYKGGAAFAECVDLPHTVGLVTDLSPHLVRRALTSLRAELKYREELLAEHGAKDLISMERRSDPAAPPALLIIIDEFAALASDVPEFVDGVIDIAQRGRSLGLHLVMATQRPAGVIKDNLRANTNLRIALRMADESDSTDVISVKDAAFFDAETPGRGAIKVGPGRLAHFQTGYLGGRMSQSSRAADIELRSLGLLEGEPWELPAEHRATGHGAAEQRDIERLRDGIIDAGRLAGLPPPRRPWLDELPITLALEELLDTGRTMPNTTVIGLRDDPSVQSQGAVGIDFESVGNIAVIGAGGTGKTSALLTLAAALSQGALEDPVQIYAIDAASGALEALRTLPTVGAVAQMTDKELVNRVLRHLLEVIAERGPRYAAARASGLAAYREIRQEEHESRVFLILDGFAAFRQAGESIGGAEQALQMLSEIMMNGRAVGVHVIITSDRPSAIPAAMTASLQQQFSLRLANANDYGALGLTGDALESAPPGRAMAAGDDRELQFAVLGGHGDLVGQSQALERLATTLADRGVSTAPKIKNAPQVLDIGELPTSEAGLPVFGVRTHDLEPALMPVQGLGVIAGPSGSGLSQTALSCVEALDRLAAEQDENVDAVLLTFATEGLQRARNWSRIAETDEEIAALSKKLVAALGGRPADRSRGIFSGGVIGGEIDDGTSPIEGASTPDPPFVFPTPKSRGVIVVERSAEAEDSDALPQLVALAKVARRAGVLVLFEFEMGSASAIWDLYQALKQPKWGLTLQPDDGESQSPFREHLGRVRRADFPPGRGIAIEQGRTTPVHVAMTDREATCEHRVPT